MSTQARKEKSLSKLVRPRPKGQITLPVEFRRRLKIDSRTILNLTLKGERIEIVPLRPTPQDEYLRNYGEHEIASFIAEDRIDSRAAAKVRRLLGR